MMQVRLVVVLSMLLFSYCKVWAQIFVAPTGDWNTAINWSTLSVPAGTGTDATISINTNPTISSSGSPHVIGNVTGLGTNDITVDPTGSLTLGSSALFGGGTSKNLTLGNATNVFVDGYLEVWGNLIVGNATDFIITGTFIVHGNVTIQNNGDLRVDGTGSLDVGGNFIGGANTDLATTGSGTINIDGDLSLSASSSSITGPDGSITVGGTCSLNGGACPLTVTPVELLFFDGLQELSYIELNWATASEENFDHFEIERAVEGVSFEKIGEIKGAGTSMVKLDYEFIDKFPETGLNYYRLKNVDLDGSFEYSDIIMVEYSNEIQFQIAPNPTSGQIRVATDYPEFEELIYLLSDQNGAVVRTGVLSSFYTTIDLSDLTKGLYFFYIKDKPSFKPQRILLR